MVWFSCSSQDIAWFNRSSQGTGLCCCIEYEEKTTITKGLYLIHYKISHTQMTHIPKAENKVIDLTTIHYKISSFFVLGRFTSTTHYAPNFISKVWLRRTKVKCEKIM